MQQVFPDPARVSTLGLSWVAIAGLVAALLVLRWVFRGPRPQRFAPAYQPRFDRSERSAGWGHYLGGTAAVVGLMLLGAVFVGTTKVVREQATHASGEEEIVTIHTAGKMNDALLSPMPPEPLTPSSPPTVEANELAPEKSASGELDAKRPLNVKVTTYEQGVLVTQDITPEMPDWVVNADQPVRDGDTVRMVLASKRFESEGECITQLTAQLHDELRKQASDRYPELAANQTWKLPLFRLQEFGIVKRQCVATYPLQVKEFEVQVQQVHWDVELSTLGMQRVYAAWRPAFIHDRLLQLGAALGAATSGLGLASLFLRRAKTTA